MATPAQNLQACKETPSCGSPVLDRRAHRKWHALMWGNDGPPRTFVRGLVDERLEVDENDCAPASEETGAQELD